MLTSNFFLLYTEFFFGFYREKWTNEKKIVFDFKYTYSEKVLKILCPSILLRLFKISSYKYLLEKYVNAFTPVLSKTAYHYISIKLLTVLSFKLLLFFFFLIETSYSSCCLLL